MRAHLVLASAICLAAAPAVAQPKPAPRTAAPVPTAQTAAPPVAPAPTPPAAVSEAARKEASELTELLGTQGSVTGFVGVVRERMILLMANASQKQPEEVARSVDELLLPDLQSHTPDLRAAVTAIWAQHFTLQEMKDLHAFYLTPLGSKLIRLQPQIAQETQGYGRDWAEKYAKETADKHLDELRKRGLIPAAAATPGPAATPAPAPLP